MKSRTLTIGIVAVALLGGAVATADETDDVNAARMHYKKGTREFELGHYDQAIKEYEAAYQAKDDPALLYNLGQAYRLNGDYNSALRAYKSYLHRLPDAPNADEVRARIDEMQKAVDERRRATQAPEPMPAPTSSPNASKPTTPPTPIVAPATAPPAQHAESTPIYRKWWLWTIVGVVVVGGAAAGVAIALTSTKSDGFNPTIPDVGPGPHTTSLTVHF